MKAIYGMLTLSLGLILGVGAIQFSFARIINIPDDFEAIQEGIDASRPGDTVLVHPGNYEHTQLTISHDLTLAGEYLLTGDERSIVGTVLHGDPRGTTIFVPDREINLWLVGLRLSNGGSGIQSSGGNGIPFIYVFHCRFENIERAIIASGIAGVVLDNSIFYDNGRIYIMNHRNVPFLRIRNCNFEDNEGLSFGHHSRISNCQFINNRPHPEGLPAIELASGIVSDCYFEGNSGDAGGALHLGGGDVVNCTFIGNSSENQGGAIYIGSGGDVNITKCTFLGNSSENQGGAIYILTGSGVGITNCTFFGNASGAGEGGDLFFEGGEPELEWGGGHLFLSNNIIYEGEPQAIGVRLNQRSEFTISYSDIQGGRENISGDLEQGQFTWGEGNIDEDPLFLDPENGDFHLTADSPCLDAGDPENPPDPDGTRADIGAFYFHQRDIEVEPEALEFAGVQTGAADTAYVLIRNIGLTRLTLHIPEIDPPDSPFEVQWEWDGDGEVPEQSEYLLPVVFSSEQEAQYNATLFILSDDPDEDTVTVALIGEALSVFNPSSLIPHPLSLSISPNPFNAMSTVRFAIPRPAAVHLALYDLQGRFIQTVAEGGVSAGRHSTALDGSSLPAGVYWLRMTAGEFREVRKVVLVR